MLVAIYARYSTERQTEASIADQMRVCRAYAVSRGWPVTSEHSDEGISGAALGNRPGALAAMAATGSGDVILVNDLSRLSRSQDLAPLLTRLRHRGVRVIGVQDGFDSDSRTATMQAGLSGIMSEEFRRMIGDRVWSAHEWRARAGMPTGGKAYGNREIVTEAFTRFANGESMKAIASDFNQRGIPSPGASWKARSGVRGRWLVSALHAMLHNELYAGRVVWNRSRWVKDPDTGKRLRRERPESEWIVRAVEPWIDVDTWRRVQARFHSNRGRGGVRRYLLSGILECALCGSKMIVMGGGQHRYVCSQFHGGGPHACSNSATIPRLLIEAEVLTPVERDLLSPESFKVAIAEMRKARAEKPRQVMDRDVAELERLVREGVLSAETLAPALAEARRKAQERCVDLDATGMPWPSEKLWRETVAQMREVLKGDDVVAARDVLRELIGPAKCEPAEGGMIVELTARRTLVATGSGRWVGSGGGLRTYIPTKRRRV